MIRVGLIGCGNQFRKIYFDVINRLIKEKEIVVSQAYSRNIKNIFDLSSTFKCTITNNINDIIYNTSIDLLIVSIPIQQRKILYNCNLKNTRFILSEVPFSDHLGDFYKIRRKILKQKIKFEVFEDRYYFDYNFEFNDEIKFAINFNKQWMHHSISQIFKIKDNLGDLMEVRYNVRNREFDIYKFYFSNFKFLYYFSKNKKEVDREKGYLKIFNSKKESFKLSPKYSNFKNVKQEALYKCIKKLLDHKNDNNLYFDKYLEKETFLITVMKIMKKIKLQNLKSYQLTFLQKIFKFYSYLG